MLGRYEHTRDGHNKFWSISFNEKNRNYLVNYGSIGTKGNYATYKTAEDAHKKIKEKLGKGYILVEPEGGEIVLKSSDEDEKKAKKSSPKPKAEEDDFGAELKKASAEYKRLRGLDA